MLNIMIFSVLHEYPQRQGSQNYHA